MTYLDDAVAEAGALAQSELASLRQRCEDLTGIVGRIVAARKYACDSLLKHDRDAMDAASRDFDDALREAREALRGGKR